MSIDPVAADNPNVPQTDATLIKGKLLIVTTLQCATCVLLYILIHLSGKSDTWEGLAKWGYLSSTAIWDGAYWGLLSSAFIHLAIWHLAFNVYWLWILGGVMEKYIGPWKILLFTLLAAFVTSAAQLATSDETGIGSSGIVYSIFGFLWVGSKKIPEFEQVLLSKSIVPLFLIWLVGCIVVSYFGIYQIGNTAHVSGLCFGIIVGYASFHNKLRKPAILLVVLMIIGCCVTLVWSPWSASWVGYKGFKAHEAREYELAISRYRKSIELGMDRKWALRNIVLAHSAQGDSRGYSAALTELRQIDPKAALELEKEILVPQLK